MVHVLHEKAAERLVNNLRSDAMLDIEPDVLQIPTRHFVDAGRAAAERELLRTLPLVVGHQAEIPEPGAFITRDVLGTSIIITGQSDGTVAGFHNMCRHRGGIVESESSGNARLFTCRYHGWSYERDGGTLRNRPFAESFGNLDAGCRSLSPSP